MRAHRSWSLGCLFVLSTACEPPLDLAAPCNSDDECGAAEACVDGRCRSFSPRFDGGTTLRRDAGDADDDGGATPGDAGSAPGDAGATNDDGGLALDDDAGPTADDAGPPPDDAGPPPDDAGPPPDDAGPPLDDAGPPPDDAGPPPGLVKVGVDDTSCPAASSGACDIWPAQGAGAITRAVQQAGAGGTVWLYQGSYDGQVVVDASVVIEGAPGEDRAAIIVTHSTTLNPALIRLLADGVTLRDFTIVAGDGVRRAITAQDNDDIWVAPTSFSVDHVVERLVIQALGPAFQGINSTQEAILAGPGMVIRNNFFYGWWEGSLDVGDQYNRAIDGVTFVHNSVVQIENQGLFQMGAGSSMVVKNNAAVTLNGPALAVFEDDDGTFSAVVEHNFFGGFSDLSAALDDAAQLTDPRFVDALGPALATGSPALNAVPYEPLGGVTDLVGRLRATNGDVTAGALAATGTSPRLPQTLSVGRETNGCALTACDFSGADGIARAALAAHPGSTIEVYGPLFGDPAVFGGDILVHHPLTLRRASFSPAGSVVIENSAASAYKGLVTVTQADGVVVERLDFRVNAGGVRALWFDPGYQYKSTSSSAASDGLVRRVVARALSMSDVEEAFWLSHGGRLRSSIARGTFECLASVHAGGAEIVGNTFSSQESSADAMGFRIGASSDLVIANNLIDLTGASAGERVPASLSDDYPAPVEHEVAPVSPLFVHNFFYGITALSQALGDYAFDPSGAGDNCVAGSANVPAPARCASDVPGFLDAAGGDLRLSAGADGVDSGDGAYSLAGELDVAGGARVQGASVDVGAHEQ